MAWALAGRPAASGGQDETCHHWAAPGRSQVRVRPIYFFGRAAASCQIGIAFEKMHASPPAFRNGRWARALCSGHANGNPPPMSTPLLLRIGLFLCVHVGIVAGVLAFP